MLPLVSSSPIQVASSWNTCPADILRQICFNFLKIPDLLSASQSCKKWRKAVLLNCAPEILFSRHGIQPVKEETWIKTYRKWLGYLHTSYPWRVSTEDVSLHSSRKLMSQMLSAMKTIIINGTVFQERIDPNNELIDDQNERLDAFLQAVHCKGLDHNKDHPGEECMEALNAVYIATGNHAHHAFQRILANPLGNSLGSELIKEDACMVEIFNTGGFVVTNTRKYILIESRDPIWRPTPKKYQAIALITCIWTIVARKGHPWQGKIQIPEEIQFFPCVRHEDKTKILKAVNGITALNLYCR